MSVEDGLRQFDRFQQRHAPLGFAVAVLKKYADDQAGHLAALLAYWAFFGLFPLLLLLITVLGFVLEQDPALQQDILKSAFSDVPVLGQQLRQNVHSLHGSGLALAIGLAGALWAGLGVTQATQSAFNRIWNVPFRKRPDFLRSRIRGLLMLFLLGGLNLLSTGLTSLAGSTGVGSVTAVSGHAVSAIVNLLLFLAAFRLLTAEEVTLRELWPGVLLAAVFWQLLQEFAAVLLRDHLNHMNLIYGTFGFVLGLMVTLYLAAQATILAAEINVVRARRLWPRSILAPLVEGDRRALTSSAEVEERVDEEEVSVTFTK